MLLAFINLAVVGGIQYVIVALCVVVAEPTRVNVIDA